MKFSRSLLFVFILAGILVYISCRKIDHQSDNSMKGDTESRFFNSHRSSDAVEAAIVNFIKIKNSKKHFVERTVKQIGYPYWNKMLRLASKPVDSYSSSHSENDIDIFLVPFVRDSQSVVNGCLMVFATATDTSFKYLQDWQYRDTAGTGMEPRFQSLLLMQLDKNVFGDRLYKIKDTAAFGKDDLNREIKFVKINSGTAGKLFSKKDGQTDQLFTLVTFTYCYTAWVPGGHLTGCDPEDPNCITLVPVTTCSTFSFWAEVIEDQGGGGTGNGGGGEPGGGSGGGGGSTPPVCQAGPVLCEPGWVPYPTNNPPGDDPCTIANNAAKKMDTLFTRSKADSVLGTITNLATSTVEQGFLIFKRFTVNPNNVQDTTITSYFSGSVQQGLPTEIVLNVSIPYLSLYAANLHTHTATEASPPSAGDIYLLIGSYLNFPRFEGRFIVGADGSQYALTVTNPVQAAAFLNTQTQYWDPNTHNWKDTSAIGIEFNNAKRYYKKIYKGNPNMDNLAYEMAMAAVLNKFNSGITLSKKNAAGNFKPIVISITNDPRKPRRIIYVQLCN